MNAMTFLAAAALFASAGRAEADVKTEEVEYTQGDAALQGFVARPDKAKGKRPGESNVTDATPPRSRMMPVSNSEPVAV